MRKIVVLLLILFALPFAQTAQAGEMPPEPAPEMEYQAARTEYKTASGKDINKPYVGVDAGLAFAFGAKFNNFNDGVRSRCDLHYAGQTGFVANAAEYRSDTGCTGFPGSQWSSDHKTSIGHTVGLTAGVSRVLNFPVRAEIEYLYRNNEFDDRVPLSFVGAKSPEFDSSFGGQAFGRLGNIKSHNVLLNLYYDHQMKAKVTPYIGGGFGWSRTKADLLHFFQRNDRRREETTDAFCLPGVEPSTGDNCVPEVLEGAVSSSLRTHEDDLFVFQVLLGVDYALTERLSAGLKLRWAFFTELEEGPKTWDTLRNHASTVSPETNPDLDLGGRSNTVTYRSRTTDTQFWGTALSLKYHLN